MTSQHALTCGECGRDVVEECSRCPECVQYHRSIRQLLLCALTLLLAGVAMLAMAASVGH